MVEILDKSTDSCVVARFSGKITGEEYKKFIDAVDSRLENRDSISMVTDLSDFNSFADADAFKEDWHFGVHEYWKMDRVAFVGDQKWIDLFVKVIGVFSKAADRAFPAGSLDEAYTWACGPEA